MDEGGTQAEVNANSSKRRAISKDQRKHERVGSSGSGSQRRATRRSQGSRKIEEEIIVIDD
jgi:hypothetical protein